MISINEAVAQGVTKVRKPLWANPEDYLQLDIIDGKLGPWTHLYSSLNEKIGEPNPQDILFTGVGDLDESSWKEFDDGPTVD